MIDMKATSKNIISVIENNLNDLRKGELMQLIVREELECIVIKLPVKTDSTGTPTWVDLIATVYTNGAFEDKYKEKKQVKV